MNKRGQVTVFVIISIIVVSVLLVFFTLRSGIINNQVNPEIGPMHNYIQNCIDRSAEDAIYHIGQFGGYYVSPEKSNSQNIPYYFYNGENLMLPLEQIQEELSEYMKNEIFFCTKNFVDFPDFEVTQSEIDVESRILKDEVAFKVEYPLGIKKGESTYALGSFNSEVPSRLNDVYEVSSMLVDQQMLDGKDICINCISDISYENKIFVSLIDDPFDEDVIIYSLVDEEKKINGEDYLYYFANRFDL